MGLAFILKKEESYPEAALNRFVINYKCMQELESRVPNLRPVLADLCEKVLKKEQVRRSEGQLERSYGKRIVPPSYLTSNLPLVASLIAARAASPFVCCRPFHRGHADVHLDGRRIL